ncbi:GNAT family N-acetyltransferase [Bacillus safensis]|uniref:GNAT family N-acetyltransferase n=1 Tax=Bacillus TaxID=1386 RepID=UPI000F7AC8F7|nr:MULTISPECIES: GNAT family N-acetyltransferase [Bacillus]MCM3368639.1 GNAT family N-acetyltransferase [Bacillus safensis]MCY7705318.1 GNAT family N-acetyltransferase [Bacillus safensis]MCY7722433.1 GNAT family N-acetyltransferase [Bacillus safensis]MDJ0291959.1 GNAT family N-acetyltransferase [Bacillus safensis]MED0729394.1 GNAT family N-acetyltransferase [Bacillus safensis]
MFHFRLAREDELPQVAELLDDSFQDYSFFDLLCEKVSNRSAFARQLHLVNTKVYFQHQICLVGVENENIVSAALLKHPRLPEPSVMDYVLSGGLKLLFIGGISAVQHVFRVLKEAKKACSSLKQPYWYLEALVVAKDQQGKKLGSRMLKQCLFPFIARQGGGLFTLMTHNEANRHFYRKNGWMEFDERVLHGKEMSLESWSYKTVIK